MSEPALVIEVLHRAVLDGVHESDSTRALAEGEGEPQRVRVDLGLVTLFADERPLQGLAGLIDWRRSGRLSSLIRSGFCTGIAGERLMMPGCAGLPVERLVLVGLGVRAEFDQELARRIAGELVATARGLGARRVLVALPSHTERRSAELLFAGLTEAIDGSPTSPTSPSSPSSPDAEPEPAPDVTTQWWVVAEERVVARLRRVLIT